MAKTEMLQNGDLRKGILAAVMQLATVWGPLGVITAYFLYSDHLDRTEAREQISSFTEVLVDDVQKQREEAKALQGTMEGVLSELKDANEAMSPVTEMRKEQMKLQQDMNEHLRDFTDSVAEDHKKQNSKLDELLDRDS